MVEKCETCTEKCPMGEMAHNAALGRMYATNEFVSLLKKVENGELVEVVRCAQCIYSNSCEIEGMLLGDGIENPYCAGGERREENHLTFASLEDVVNEID